MQTSVLVTGGAGYIGSHAVKRLLEDGRDVVVVDDLSRGNRGAINLLGVMPTGRQGSLVFHELNILDTARLAEVIREHAVDSALHFAALAYVRESVEKPTEYRRVNVGGMKSLLEACAGAGAMRIVLSSSCATYGAPDRSLMPIREDCPQRPINPYGETKVECERLLLAHRERTGARVAALRYFNVAGADTDGLLGEDHRPETHIIPLAIQAALGRRDCFTILGTDLATPDGTCVRDYIHVQDLVDAHVLALDALAGARERLIYNLGIGRGYSVREVVSAVERATGRRVPIIEGPANSADPPTLLADASAFSRDLGWAARITSIDAMVSSALAWMVEHPDGYPK